MKKWKWQLLLTISCKNRSMRSCGGSTTDVFRWMTKQVLRVRSRYAVSFCTHTHTTHRVISLSLNDSYTSSAFQWVRLRLPHPLKVVQYICGVTRSEVWRGDADDRHVVGDLHLLLYTGQVVRLVLSKHLVWPVIVLHGAMIEPLMWDRNVKMFFFFNFISLTQTGNKNFNWSFCCDVFLPSCWCDHMTNGSLFTCQHLPVHRRQQQSTWPCGNLSQPVDSVSPICLCLSETLSTRKSAVADWDD